MGTDTKLVEQRAGNNRFLARKNRSGHDNYETPSWAVESLVKRERDNLDVLPAGYNHSLGKTEARGLRKVRIVDVCCGPGAIVTELRRLLPNSIVVGNELRDDLQFAPGCRGGIDFFNTARWDDPQNHPDWVIINPPFTLGKEFALRCHEITSRGYAVFQRTNWIEGWARYRDLWSKLPIRTIYPFVHRVNCYPEGQVDAKTSGMLCFAWYVFEHGYSGPPCVCWIDDKAHFTYDTRIGVTPEMRQKKVPYRG